MNLSTSVPVPRHSRFLSLLVIGLLMTAGVVACPVRPAAGLTNDERFVARLYDDFKGRPATSSEMTWQTTVLANGTSRASLVSGFFEDAESDGLYARLGYLLLLDREPTSTELTSGATLVNTANGYLTLETNLLSGAEFFANSGSTNDGYVAALYERVLLRTGGASEISYWSGQISSAAKTRAQVATSFVRSTEGSDRRVGGPSGAAECLATSVLSAESITAGAYCIVLERMASTSDLSYWAPSLSSTGNLIDVFIWLASSSEYYKAV